MIFHVEFRMKSVKCTAIGTSTAQGRATAPGYVRTMLSVLYRQYRFPVYVVTGNNQYILVCSGLHCDRF